MTPETIFLGAYLSDPKTVGMYAAEAGISPAHFNDPRLGEIYEIASAQTAQYGKTDRYTVLSKLESDKNDRLLSAWSQIPTDCIPQLAERPIHDMDKAYRSRRLQSISTAIYERTRNGENPSDIATSTLSDIIALQSLGGSGIKTLATDRPEKVEAWKAAQDGAGIVGIPTPWPLINDGLGGFRPRVMSVLGAYRGTGKSSATRQIIYNAAKHHQTPCALVTLEDPSDIASAHIASLEGEFSPFHMDRGDSKVSIAHADRAWQKIEKLPIWIYDRPSNINQIESTLSMLVARHGIKFAVIDHIQYILPDRRYPSRNDEIAHYSMRIAAMAKRLNIHALVCSQLSRDSEKNQRPPRLSDLRDSGSIEQDARAVVMLYQCTDGQQINDGKHQYDGYVMHVAKNNYGRSGDKVLFARKHTPVRFDEVQRYVD